MVLSGTMGHANPSFILEHLLHRTNSVATFGEIRHLLTGRFLNRYRFSSMWHNVSTLTCDRYVGEHLVRRTIGENDAKSRLLGFVLAIGVLYRFCQTWHTSIEFIVFGLQQTFGQQFGFYIFLRSFPTRRLHDGLSVSDMFDVSFGQGKWEIIRYDSLCLELKKKKLTQTSPFFSTSTTATFDNKWHTRVHTFELANDVICKAHKR